MTAEQKSRISGQPPGATEDYGDIINLPHHVSKTHLPMSGLDRAAQFAPFAALTGLGAAVKETARLTEQRQELNEDAAALLDKKMRVLRERLCEAPEVTVTYFVPDSRKSGGRYASATGRVTGLSGGRRTLELNGGMAIPVDDIYGLDGPVFDML